MGIMPFSRRNTDPAALKIEKPEHASLSEGKDSKVVTAPRGCLELQRCTPVSHESAKDATQYQSLATDAHSANEAGSRMKLRRG